MKRQTRMYKKGIIMLMGMVFFLSGMKAQEKKDAEWEGFNPETGGPPALSPLPTELQLKYHHMEKQMFIHFTVNNFTGKQWGDGTEIPDDFNPYDQRTDPDDYNPKKTKTGTKEEGAI